MWVTGAYRVGRVTASDRPSWSRPIVNTSPQRSSRRQVEIGPTGAETRTGLQMGARPPVRRKPWSERSYLAVLVAMALVDMVALPGEMVDKAGW